MQNDRSLGKWRANDKIPGYIEHSINPRVCAVCIYIFLRFFSLFFTTETPTVIMIEKAFASFLFLQRDGSEFVRLSLLFDGCWHGGRL